MVFYKDSNCQGYFAIEINSNNEKVHVLFINIKSVGSPCNVFCNLNILSIYRNYFIIKKYYMPASKVGIEIGF